MRLPRIFGPGPDERMRATAAMAAPELDARGTDYDVLTRTPSFRMRSNMFGVTQKAPRLWNRDSRLRDQRRLGS